MLRSRTQLPFQQGMFPFPPPNPGANFNVMRDYFSGRMDDNAERRRRLHGGGLPDPDQLDIAMREADRRSGLAGGGSGMPETPALPQRPRGYLGQTLGPNSADGIRTVQSSIMSQPGGALDRAKPVYPDLPDPSSIPTLRGRQLGDEYLDPAPQPPQSARPDWTGGALGMRESALPSPMSFLTRPAPGSMEDMVSSMMTGRSGAAADPSKAASFYNAYVNRPADQALRNKGLEQEGDYQRDKVEISKEELALRRQQMELDFDKFKNRMSEADRFMGEHLRAKLKDLERGRWGKQIKDPQEEIAAIDQLNALVGKYGSAGGESYEAPGESAAAASGATAEDEAAKKWARAQDPTLTEAQLNDPRFLAWAKRQMAR